MKQLELIDKVQNMALKDDEIKAILMYGSFVKNEGDKYSDIEFYFFVTNKETFKAEQWVSGVDNLLLFFKNEFGTDVAIYENFIRAEYHFLNASEVNIVKSWEGFISFAYKDKMMLVDKDHVLKNVLDDIKQIVPQRIDPTNIDWLASSLINFLLQTANLLGRREWAHAHMSLGYVQKYLLWMMRIEEKTTDHWESPTKALEKDLSPERYMQYIQLTCRAKEKALKKAISVALAEANKLFSELKVSKDIIRVLTMIDLNKIMR